MLWRFLRKSFSYAAYHLYAQPIITTTDTVVVEGIELTVPPSVFHPTLYFSTGVFASYLRRLPLEGKRVLDMGCGSGILGLIAASRGARVLCVDRNPEAVRATRQNAAQNRLLKDLTVLESDLFSGLIGDVRFDYILFNPPFYPKEPSSPASYAWHAGEGYRVLRAFLEGSAPRLTKEGVVLLIVSSEMDLTLLHASLVEHRFVLETVASKRLLFERFSVLRAAPMP